MESKGKAAMVKEAVSGMLRPFICHGVEFASWKGAQATGTCPFCDKAKHFYVNKRTGQWDCKSCGETGNIITFLTKYSEEIRDLTTKQEYKSLEKLRGIPAAVLKSWHIGFDGSEWLLPVVSEKGTVRDIRRWDPRKKIMRSTAGCKNQLYGAVKASQVPKDGTIWICEGEWDTIALSWILKQVKLISTRTVGVPGAATFKEGWVELFKDKNVVLAYDKDRAGELGLRKAIQLLAGEAKSIKVIRWADALPLGYDVRDWVLSGRAKGLGFKQIYDKLSQQVRSIQDLDAIADLAPEGPPEIQWLSKQEAPMFEDVVKVWKRYINWNENMEECLQIILATAMSVRSPGDPLWVYIVGPPGCGKTMLINSIADFPGVYYMSTMTSKALVSGFKDEKQDSSVIPQLDQKCFASKDFTEILHAHPNERHEIYATLRGAYDGRVKKVFGNNVVREYWSHFSCLFGVTHEVWKDNLSSVGERFLRYGFFGQGIIPEEDLIRSALRASDKQDKMRKAVAAITTKFLSRKVDIQKDLPKLPNWVEKRLSNLARLIPRLRTDVPRVGWNPSVMDIAYKPIAEIGTRIAMQGWLLLQWLYIVRGEKEITMETWKIVERTLLDTAIPLHREMVDFMKNHPAGVTSSEIVATLGIPSTTVDRRLEDLQLMGVVRFDMYQQSKEKGERSVFRRNARNWHITAEIEDFWASIGTKDVKKKRRVRSKFRKT